jgi:uncharacterized protein
VAAHPPDRRTRHPRGTADYRQIINIAAPPIDDLGPPAVAREMARIGNESLAELVRSYPDMFLGFMAAVPLSDPDAAVAELDYATGELGALGAQIYTHLDGHAMDSPQLEPFYPQGRRAWIAGRGPSLPQPGVAGLPHGGQVEVRDLVDVRLGVRPVGIHGPRRVLRDSRASPEPAFSHPHGGSMVPHFSGRVGPGWGQLGARAPADQHEDVEGYPLSVRPIEYFRKMYVDTAMFGAAHALRCVVNFDGASARLRAARVKQASHRLAGDLGNHVVVAVDVQDLSLVQFCGCGDDQVRDRAPVTVATVRGEQPLDLQCPVHHGLADRQPLQRPLARE